MTIKSPTNPAVMGALVALVFPGTDTNHIPEEVRIEIAALVQEHSALIDAPDRTADLLAGADDGFFDALLSMREFSTPTRALRAQAILDGLAAQYVFYAGDLDLARRRAV